MGVELELSELAVLRPIQTAASAAATTTTASASARPAGDDAAADGPDAADTGCVTPTAKSSLLPRMGLGGGLDIDATTAAVAACVTPTSSPCLLRPATVCPPAPRKPARPLLPAPDNNNKRKRCCARPGLQRAFFPVPHDLSTVFVPRAAADRSPPPPPPPRAAKKARLHVVG